jgi:Flp pilus assembly protein TadD
VEPVSALVRLDLAQQHPDHAVARLNKIIERYPNNAIAHNLKGEMLADLKRTDAAVVSFREAIKLSPSWEIPYHNLAVQEITAGRSDDAIKTLQQGISAASDVTPLVDDLASLYERSGRPNEAIAQYESVLQRHTDSSVAANNLAMLLVTYHSDKSSLDRARALAERFASSRDPQLIDTWGWVLYKRGENTDAINILQKAVDMAPQTPVLRYHLAMAQLKSGAREPARANLEQALKAGAPFSDSDVAKKTLAELNR